MEYMYITNRPEIARIADTIGIDRVWIDLERLGKAERQKGIDSVKSKHEIKDILAIKKVIKNAKLQVRINPINSCSKDEIERVIAYGADIIMLPYYKTLNEIDFFLNLINGRALPVLLLETREANDILEKTLSNFKGYEVHVGLNDLHLAYHKKFMFELLTDGTVEQICLKLKDAGLAYGFGGIARLGHGMLPAEYILPEHFRLRSTRVILSRSFFEINQERLEEAEFIMRDGFKGLKDFERKLLHVDSAFLNNNYKKIVERVKKITNENQAKECPDYIE